MIPTVQREWRNRIQNGTFQTNLRGIKIFTHTHTHGQPCTLQQPSVHFNSSTTTKQLFINNKSFIHSQQSYNRLSHAHHDFWVLWSIGIHPFTTNHCVLSNPTPSADSNPSFINHLSFINDLSPVHMLAKNRSVSDFRVNSEHPQQLIRMHFRLQVPWHTTRCVNFSDVYHAFNTDENHSAWESICFSWCSDLIVAFSINRNLAFCHRGIELWSQSHGCQLGCFLPNTCRQ